MWCFRFFSKNLGTPNSYRVLSHLGPNYANHSVKPHYLKNPESAGAARFLLLHVRHYPCFAKDSPRSEYYYDRLGGHTDGKSDFADNTGQHWERAIPWVGRVVLSSLNAPLFSLTRFVEVFACGSVLGCPCQRKILYGKRQVPNGRPTTGLD